MKVITLIAVISSLTLIGCGGSDNSTNRVVDVIDDAHRVCSAMRNTGLTSECDVKGAGRTVDVRIDTTGLEAKKICKGAAEEISKMTKRFKGEWKLRIFSPYSGDHPLAVCAL